MDPTSVMFLFVLFQATEKVISYAGGKVADSVTKPLWEALEGKAKWLTGKDDTSKRWEAFSKAFTEARVKLEKEGRHPEVAKQVAHVLGNFTVVDSADKEWLNDLSSQFEKASLVSEKPDEFLLVELFSKVFSKQNMQFSRAELSETVSDFVAIFQDRIFAQAVYQEEMFKRAQWQALRQPHYDRRERYISQVIDHNENLDFVGIPELKDRQALRIEDVFVSLQTQGEEKYRLTINHALAECSKLVILGEPGSGKTTLLKYILMAFAKDKTNKIGLSESRLPIFIRLYDYVSKRMDVNKGGFSFTDYLNKYCSDNLQLHLPPDFFEKALEAGECCVCFDGIDEVGGTEFRREISLAISAMVNLYPKNRFIVTSRIVGYEEAPLDRNDFCHQVILPLNDEDIKFFIEKWYQARERDMAIRRERIGRLVETVTGDERIKTLASNPLMLTIIALVHHVEAELPHERVKLYDKCVTTLTETWDRVRGMRSPLRRRLLEKLAYWIHSQPRENGQTHLVTEQILKTKLIQFLQSDPKSMLDENQTNFEIENFITVVKSRSGLLVERSEGYYSFSNLVFQEYLAACDIEKRLAYSIDAIWNEIEHHIIDPHWREVILLLLASLNRFEEHNTLLISKLLEVNTPGGDGLFLAVEALLDRVEVPVSLRREITSRLVDATRESDPSISIKAMSLLTQFPGEDFTDVITELVDDTSVDMKTRVFAALDLIQTMKSDKLINFIIDVAHTPRISDDDKLKIAVHLFNVNEEKKSIDLLKYLIINTDRDDYKREIVDLFIDFGEKDDAFNVLLSSVFDKRALDQSVSYGLSRFILFSRILVDKVVDVSTIKDLELAINYDALNMVNVSTANPEFSIQLPLTNSLLVRCVNLLRETIDSLEKFLRVKASVDKLAYITEASESLRSLDASLASLDTVEKEMMGRVVDRWNTIIAAEREIFLGSADVRLSIKNRKSFFAKDVYVVVDIENIGQSEALSILVELRPERQYSITSVSKRKLDQLSRGQKEVVEFIIEPETTGLLDLEFKVSWDDREDNGKVAFYSLKIEVENSITMQYSYVKNPYIVGIPIRPDLNAPFVGRQKIFDLISDNLKGSGQKNALMLVGDRRTGKTSLLLHLKKHLSGNLHVAYIDCQGLNENGSHYYVYSIFRKIVLALPDLEVKIPNKEEFAQSPFHTFQELIDKLVYDLNKEERIVIIFDEFEALHDRIANGKLHEDIFDLLRHNMQHTQNLAFILSGTNRLRDMVDNYQSVLYGLPIPYEIGLLDKMESRELICTPVASSVKYDDLAIEKIYRATNGHPYLVQIICYNLIQNMNIQKTSNYIGVSEVEDVLNLIVEKVDTHLRWWWKPIALEPDLYYQQLTLSAMSYFSSEGRKVLARRDIFGLLNNKLENVDKLENVLDRLIARQLVSASDGFYSLSFDLLTRWVNRKHPLHSMLEE